MASDESIAMMISSSMQDDDGDDTDEYGNYVPYDHHSHTHNMSRLSMMCTSSMDDNIDDDVNNMSMSKLSLESFDGHDADEEFSDADSDKEPACYSLPATPPRRRVFGGAGGLLKDQLIRVKDYASENELQNGGAGDRRRKNWRKRKVIKQRSVRNQEKYNMGFDHYSEESESGLVAGGGGGGGHGGGDGGVMVITRPKGGGRSLCMDLEEVKACKDLGFELEHERIFSGSGRASVSASTLDTATSSGGNSPIGSWRISSPGDDPRDVKARLKVWAQAVALASSSRHCY